MRNSWNCGRAVMFIAVFVISSRREFYRMPTSLRRLSNDSSVFQLSSGQVAESLALVYHFNPCCIMQPELQGYSPRNGPSSTVIHFVPDCEYITTAGQCHDPRILTIGTNKQINLTPSDMHASHVTRIMQGSVSTKRAQEV